MSAVKFVMGGDTVVHLPYPPNDLVLELPDSLSEVNSKITPVGIVMKGGQGKRMTVSVEDLYEWCHMILTSIEARGFGNGRSH